MCYITAVYVASYSETGLNQIDLNYLEHFITRLGIVSVLTGLNQIDLNYLEYFIMLHHV